MRTKLVALAIIALSACGKDEPGAHAPAVANAASSVAKAPSSVEKDRADAFKVKGLYLGMDIQDVPGAFTDMLAEMHLSGYGFTDVIKYSNGERCVLLYDKQFLGVIEARMQERYTAGRAQQKIDEELQSSCYASDGVLVVKSGENGRVSRIEFNAVAELFNAKNSAPADFAKQFADEYRIPVLKPNGERSGWLYVAPDGTKAEVLVKKIFGRVTTRLYLY